MSALAFVGQFRYGCGMNSVDRFLADIDAFLARTGLAESAFGRRAVHDGSFISDIRKGRSPSLGLVDDTYQFMREYEREKAND